MDSFPSVLIFTCSEYGQANVCLATAYELALAGVNVYIASFAPLGDRVACLQERITLQGVHASGRPVGSVVFCECNGFMSWREAFGKHGLPILGLRHPPGVLGAVESYARFGTLGCPWSREEYLAGINNCKEIITTIRPDVVVIDIFFSVPRDACKLIGQRFATILPSSALDIAKDAQPYMAAFWKYPIISSGFPFPLTWWQSLLNIYLNIRLIVSVITSVQMGQVRALRQSLGIKPTIDNLFRPRMTHICASLPETDFPLAVIPEEIDSCGPIIVPFDPLEECDPELKMWLDNGPTVMINLGTHIIADDTLAREIGGAIRMLLDHHDQDGKKGAAGRMQVLWKTKRDSDMDCAIEDVIGKEVKEGRVKVVAWLNAEPVSVLQHPNVVCTVHHGGANSFFEGVWSGIPHVVLPVWMDTYHYAARAEYLNIGVYGSKKSAPGAQAEELGRALVRVTGDTEEAVGFRKEAERLKGICRARESGRKLASLAILKEVGLRT